MKPSSRHETALAAGEWTWTTAPSSSAEDPSKSVNDYTPRQVLAIRPPYENALGRTRTL